MEKINLKFHYALLASLLLLAGCAKSSEEKAAEATITSQNACSQDTINVLNKFAATTRAYQQQPDPKTLADIGTQCSDIQNMLGSETCLAINKKTGVNTEITADKYRAICDQIH